MTENKEEIAPFQTITQLATAAEWGASGTDILSFLNYDSVASQILQ